MLRMMDIPVVPVMSPTTTANRMFIWVIAFCMRCTLADWLRTKSPRWRT